MKKLQISKEGHKLDKEVKEAAKELTMKSLMPGNQPLWLDQQGYHQSVVLDPDFIMN